VEQNRDHASGRSGCPSRTSKEPSDPSASARSIGLRYVSSAMPGIRREKAGHSFRYRNPRGKAIRSPSTLARIRSLVIPPAWTDVWICRSEHGHLQATGRDARGRKQFRYHQRWREVRDETKYSHMIAFARTLPRIRRRVARDLRRSGLPREKILAAIIRLLDASPIRVGNDEYARTNKSFGLTTMRNRHVKVSGAKLQFLFRGKSGKMHSVDIEDARLAKIVRNCQTIPGQELFQYVDDNRKPQDIGSGDVNGYLRAISGGDFTAKDFRTWRGTVHAATTLKKSGHFSSVAQGKQNIVQAVRETAQSLGNTPSVCR
jgi:DNA topoisomerase-1